MAEFSAEGSAGSIGRAQFELAVDDQAYRAQLEKVLQLTQLNSTQIAAVFDKAAEMYGLSFKKGGDAAVAAVKQANNEIAANSEALYKTQVASKALELEATRKFAAAVEQEYNRITGTLTKEAQLQVDAATKAADAEIAAFNKAAFARVAAEKKARDDEEKATEAALDKALKADAAYNQKIINAKRTLSDAIIANKLRQVNAEIKEEEKLAQQQSQGGGLFGLGRTQATQLLVAATGIGGFYAAFRALHDVLAEVAKSTQEAREAQFELNEVYKEGSEDVAKFAAEQAKAAGRPTADVTKGVATLGGIKEQYGLTTDQIERLTKVTLDLAAAHGRPLQQAFEAVRNGLAGETDGLKQLGIVIKEDTIRNSDLLSDAEKKHFELVSEARKEEVRYAEIMRQAGEVTGAAAKRAEDSAGSFDKLKASLKNAAAAAGGLAVGIGENSTSQRALAGLTQWVEDDIAAWEKWITIIGKVVETGGRIGFFGRDVQADIAAADRARQAAGAPVRTDEAAANVSGPSDAAVRAAQEATRRRLPGIASQADEAEAASKQATDAQLREIAAQREAIDTNHENTRRQIEHTRDAAIQASHDTERAEIDSITARQQASKAYYDGAIAAAEHARDVALRAAQDTKDAAIRAIEDEVRANSEARRKEDQDLSDSQSQQQRYASDLHDRTMRGLEAEADAARRKTSDAVRGLEEQSRAEDERHRTAMRDIDDEERRQLDAIDSRLRALDRSEQQRSDKEAISNAQDRVRSARTWTERRAAEQALEDAKHRLGVDSQRAKLQDQARDVKKHFDELKRQEQEHDESVKKGLDDQKEQVRVAGQVALDQIALRKQAETDAYTQTTRDMKDRFDAEKRAIDDRRVKEDNDIATRRRTVEDAYTAEQRAIHATYDDPTTGLIPALHRSSEAASLEYDRQKRDVTTRAEHERTEIENTAKAATLANEKNTADAKRQLEIQAGYWTEWRKWIEDEIDRVRDKISKGLVPDLTHLFDLLRNAPQPTDTQNQYPQPGGVPVQGRKDLFDAVLNGVGGRGGTLNRGPLPIIVIPNGSEKMPPLPGAEPGTKTLAPGVTGKDFGDILKGYGLPLPPLLEKPGVPHPAPAIDLPILARTGVGDVSYGAKTTQMLGGNTFTVNVDARGNMNPEQIANTIDDHLQQFVMELDLAARNDSGPAPDGLGLAN